MNAQELFLLRYRNSHPGMSRALLADLTDEEMLTPLVDRAVLGSPCGSMTPCVPSAASTHGSPCGSLLRQPAPQDES